MNVTRPNRLNRSVGRSSAWRWLSIITAGLLLFHPSVSGQKTGDHNSHETTSNSLNENGTSEIREVISSCFNNQQRDARKGKKSYDICKVGNRGIGNGINFYSLQHEQKIGRKLAQEVEREAPVVTNAEVNDYITRLCERIAHNSDTTTPLIIRVLLEDEVNAFSLQGGHLYVDTGLILKADNEGQLAAVIAHEIAHVAARHCTKRDTESKLAAATSPLVVMSPLMRSKYSRDSEREADLLGVEYQYLSGYDPQEMSRFLEKMEDANEKPVFIVRPFSSYPSISERIEDIQKDIQRYLPHRDQYVIDTAAFEKMKSTVRDLVDAEKHGCRADCGFVSASRRVTSKK